MARRNAHPYHWQRYPIEKQQTQPLLTGNLPFHSYLSAHSLTIFEVAKAPEVRLSTLWNVQHNIPIRAEREPLVRAILRRMTGVAYTGPIVVHPKDHSVQKQQRPHGRRDHKSF